MSPHVWLSAAGAVRWLRPTALHPHPSREYTQLSSVKPGFILLTGVTSAEGAGARILQTAVLEQRA